MLFEFSRRQLLLVGWLREHGLKRSYLPGLRINITSKSKIRPPLQCTKLAGTGQPAVALKRQRFGIVRPQENPIHSWGLLFQDRECCRPADQFRYFFCVAPTARHAAISRRFQRSNLPVDDRGLSCRQIGLAGVYRVRHGDKNRYRGDRCCCESFLLHPCPFENE